MRSREFQPIPKDELHDLIQTSAEGQGIEIGEKEREIIDEVVASAPEKLNSQLLTRWCKKRVDEILVKYPQYKEKSAIIQNLVRNELMYKLSSEEFDQLKEIINLEQPAAINPKWIHQKLPIITSRVRGLRSPDGKIDWQFIAKKLGISDKFEAREEKNWDLNGAVKELNTQLKENPPKKLSPRYIRLNFPDLYHYFISHVRTEDQEDVDWLRIVHSLEPEFQELWTEQPRKYDKKEPKEHYRKKEEVEAVLERYKDDLYTVVEPGKNSNGKRDRIFEELIRLAQKGNDEAFDKLTDYLNFTVDEWIKTRRLPDVLDRHLDEVKDRIKRSIYLYAGGRGGFSLYLFVTLKQMARSFFSKDISFRDKQSTNRITRWNHQGMSEFRDEPADEY